MAIRLGTNVDAKEIVNIIKAATNDMDSKGIYQWDEIYPDEATLISDINNNGLYVYINEEKNIEGIIVLNENEDEAYSHLNWKYNDGKHIIIHRLCVHPKYQGRGVARKLLKFAEEFAVNNSYESIRLDAYIQNQRACRFYENAGYVKRGIVTFRKGDFYCYEKGLNICSKNMTL